MKPELASIRVQLGNMLKDTGHLDEAVNEYREALRTGSEGSDTNLQLFRALRELGREAEAVRAFVDGVWVTEDVGEFQRELLHSVDTLRKLRKGHSCGSSAMCLCSQGSNSVPMLRATFASLRSSQSLDVPADFWDLYRRLCGQYTGPAVSASIGVLVFADGYPVADVLECLRQFEIEGGLQVHGVLVCKDIMLHAAVEALKLTSKMTWDVVALHDHGDFAADRIELVVKTVFKHCDWVAFASQPVLLEAGALTRMLQVALMDGAVAVFCDEDVARPLDGVEGCREYFNPWLKGDPDPELLSSGEPLGSLVLVRRVALDENCVAGLAGPNAGTFFSWWLGFHTMLVGTGGVRYAAGPIISKIEHEPQGCEEIASPASVRENVFAGDDEISIIVLTKDQQELLETCLSSLRATAAQPDRLRVTVVDNGSSDPRTLDYLAYALRDGLVESVLRRAEPFNWSRFNNEAVSLSEAPLLLFVNNDVEVISKGWDDVLRERLRSPERGVVGVRLLYPDATIQHAGMVLGTEGSGAEHEGRGASRFSPGPRGRWLRRRSVAAVTGAFMACTRDVFHTVGGFDDLNFDVWFSDVDFCLKVRAAGLRVTYEPEIEAFHHESKSVKANYDAHMRAAKISAASLAMREKWGEFFGSDPYFNGRYARSLAGLGIQR